MKRGHIVLISGAVLLVAGIIISAVWAVQFAGSFMRDNTFVAQTSIGAGESIDTRIDVRQLDRPVSVAIGIDRAGLQQQSSQMPTSTPDIRLKEEVKDPNGRVASSSEFGDSFFTTFKPQVTGVHTVTVSNLGTSPVTVSGAFGYMPFVGSDGNFPGDGIMGGEWGLGMIIAGGALASIGLVTLIVGAIITIADNRRQSPTTTTTTEGGVTYRKE